ncbi:MAG: pre-peptidase C-terminal domain-containing protein [Gemmataceae bacterium]|nr:pre-peptidase C-terminal domain-containing protein [Gemmataceae bacterium]
MKRVWLIVMAFGLSLALPYASAGDKVLEVGKDGIKIDGKVSTDDTKVTVRDGEKKATMPAKMFQVKMSGNMIYTIALNTDDNEFDPFLIVQDKDGKQLAYDDDSGGKLNSLLKFSPPNEGTYKVFAGGLFGKPGPFTLKITQAPGEKAAAKILEVGKGIKIDDKVAVNDPMVPVPFMGKDIPRPAKLYQVKMSAGKSYTITMNTNDADFDPYIVVQDKDGKRLAFDDDSGGQLNSLLKFTPPSDGTYKVFAASLTAKAGPYTLQITEGQP